MRTPTVRRIVTGNMFGDILSTKQLADRFDRHVWLGHWANNKGLFELAGGSAPKTGKGIVNPRNDPVGDDAVIVDRPDQATRVENAVKKG